MGAVLLFNFLLYFGVVLIKKKKKTERDGQIRIEVEKLKASN